MSAPRRNLKVDTFPFLAVLLCAMGALIIVLLTMDRKARRVAKAKAEAAARQQSDDRDLQITARRQEYDRRKAEIHAAWQKKHDAQKAAIDAEAAALDAELREVHARLAAASRRLNAELGTLRAARTRLADEQAKLVNAEAALAAAQNQAGGEVQRLSATEAARARLANNLESMERTLKDLESDRKRDTNTYSLIPYRGKRGSNQRPIYVECAAAGLIFHPDKKLLPVDDLKALRAEVTRRFVARGGDPYLMLLVRPDGIEPYYRIRASVSDLDITFGYEMVDAGWQFHVPDEPATPGPATVTVPPMPSKPRPPAGDSMVRLLPPGLRGEGAAKAGLSGSVNLQRPRPFGAEEGGAPSNPDAPLPGGPVLGVGAGKGASPGTGGTLGIGAGGSGGAAPHPDAPLPGGDLPLGVAGTGTGPGGSTSGAAGRGAEGGSGNSDTLLPGSGLPSGVASGGRGAAGPAGTPPPGGTPPGGTGTGSPGGEAGDPMPPVIETAPRPRNPYLSADAPPSAPAGTPPAGGMPPGNPGTGGPGGEAGDPTSSAPRPRNPYLSADAPPSAQAGPPIARSGPADDGPRLPELPEATIRPKSRVEREPLRNARIDSNEVTVFVECCADYVVVYPGRKMIMRQAIASGALLAQVKKGLARPLLGGGTPKPQVRFLVRLGGDEAKHDAIDALRGLKVPMTQYAVQPEDDVARLVGSR